MNKRWLSFRSVAAGALALVAAILLVGIVVGGEANAARVRSSEAGLGGSRVGEEWVLGTLDGPVQVGVRGLPAAAAVGTVTDNVRRSLPRLTPQVGVRASGAVVAPPQANAVDANAGRDPQVAAPPDILTSFDGLDSTDNPFGLTPPDPQVAVGPGHVVEFVNVVGRITDKNGVAAVPDFLLRDFFAVPAGATDFDPKIIYDDIHDRFFASYVSIDLGGQGLLHLAVSQTSDPTGAWNVYAMSFPNVFPDYPGIGVTSDKFTISFNLFTTASDLFIGEQTVVVQKSDVMAGIAATVAASPVDIGRFTVRPAQNLSPGNDQYLTTWDLFSFNTLTVIQLTGTPDAGNVTEASVDVTTLTQDSPPPSVTAGPGTIDSGDFRVLEAIWRDDSLWSSASAACVPSSDTIVRSCAHLVEVETVGAPSVVQDIMFGAPAEYFSWPAIRTTGPGHLYVSLTGSHAGVFASAKVAGRLATDPPGTMSGTCALKLGEVEHLTSRWGDYLGAAVDPDPLAVDKVWVVGQYAKDDGGLRWGTYIGSLSYTASGACPPQPPPPPTAECRGVPATIIGTAAGELLIGTFGPDVIVGLGGNDLILGFGGDDLICAGDGDDVVIGGNGNDKLLGENGADFLVGGAGFDICAGGSGSDTALSCELSFGVP